MVGEMRASVMEHDTYDSLVDRILSRFANVFAEQVASSQAASPLP
jgi:hypothetical protein